MHSENLMGEGTTTPVECTVVASLSNLGSYNRALKGADNYPYALACRRIGCELLGVELQRLIDPPTLSIRSVDHVLRGCSGEDEATKALDTLRREGPELFSGQVYKEYMPEEDS